MATLYMRLNDIMEEWASAHGTDTIDVELASEWAIETGRYHREPISAKKQCMQDMRRALQQETYLDPQGNEIRTKHAVRNYKGQQTTLWVDVRIGKPAVVKEAFTQSWQGIANDVKRHSIEKQSYDLNNTYSASLPMFDYNFNQQAEEARVSGEYDDSFDDDDHDNDVN
jgi:hypothetical protein